ncbi:MAG TPA: FlgD immunoglobulin-like domain containing protein [Candidatus Acidoferrales bacterium]|nr:FlgD immunoglobulin-like domain containing protein [Candidatus Acidoferrales bacterium]
MLRFALPRPVPATVAVFDANGRCVRTLLSGALDPGEHACSWDGRDEHDLAVPPGIYTLKLEADARVVTARRVAIA